MRIETRGNKKQENADNETATKTINCLRWDGEATPHGTRQTILTERVGQQAVGGGDARKPKVTAWPQKRGRVTARIERGRESVSEGFG